MGLMAGAVFAKPEKGETASTAGVIYQTTNVWTVHLRFTPDMWKVMQPAPAAGEGEAKREAEPKYVHAELEIGTNLLKDVGVRLKGSSIYTAEGKAPKHSLKVDLNVHVKGQKLGSISKLNFHNNAADPSWMNEVLSYQLYRDAGVPAPRTAYAKVYVTVPGEHERTYLGLYSMVEDVDKPFAGDNFGNKKGAIFKPETPKLFDYLGEDWLSYRETYDPKAELTEAQTKRLIEFCKLVSKADDAEFRSKVASFLDLDEFSRFLAVTVYLSTLDSLLGAGENFYVHLHPVFQNMQFIPWDLDNSFGQFQMLGTQEQREQLSILRPWVGENRFLERVFQVPAFQTAYKTHWDSFQTTLFKPDRFQKQVDNIAAVIRPAVQEESKEKLALFERAIAGETIPSHQLGQRSPGGAGGYLKPIKAFVKARAASVSEQLSGRSKGQEIEGRPRAEKATSPE